MRALPRPRLWRAIGHPAMAGAIGVALGRREPAIGEIPAPRIAEWPSAGEFANFLEPHPSHLSNLGFGKGPCRLPLRFTRRGRRAEFCLLGTGLGWETAHGARYAPTGVPPGAEARPSPLSLIPIRFALPITAFRDVAPSAAAMTLALLPSRASLLRSSTASAVHSICTLPWLTLRRLQPQMEWSGGYSLRRQTSGTSPLSRPVSSG